MDRGSAGWIIFILSAILALVFLVSALVGNAHGRDLGQWEGQDQSLRQWYRSLMQPDAPSVSCCGEADSYFCDETFEKGHAVCVIADERDDIQLKRPHVENGTRIVIPDNKLKWDQGNPTGRGVVFLSTAGYVWCYVRPGGV